MGKGYKAPRSLRLAGMGAAAIMGMAGQAAAQTADGAAASDEFLLAQATTVDQLTVEAKRKNEHPYADPEAPYKTDRSASNKLTEELLDVSKSVTVLSAEAIKDTGANTFRDLMRVQPGVTLGTGEGGNAFGDRLFIRGFDARNDVYIDGLRDPGVGARETFAIEQVEIMKGPSSAFGGRGTVRLALAARAAGRQHGYDDEKEDGDSRRGHRGAGGKADREHGNRACRQHPAMLCQPPSDEAQEPARLLFPSGIGHRLPIGARRPKLRSGPSRRLPIA